jgi:PKD repeat protein
LPARGPHAALSRWPMAARGSVPRRAGALGLALGLLGFLATPSTGSIPAHPEPPAAARAAADTLEVTCDPAIPDQKLGIQLNYVGGDCSPGPPFTPGNLVGFAFPFDNPPPGGRLVGVRIFFISPRVPSFHLYLWNDALGLPDDTCGGEIRKLLNVPIGGDSTFTDIPINPPLEWGVGQRLWIGAVYPSTGIPPAWAIGRVSGPSTTGRAYANFTGDHADWFDLHDFDYGQCYGVRAIVGANAAPVADAGGPYCGLPFANIAFDGLGSHDPDGDLLGYHWDFGDGGTATGPTPTHAYSAPGNYPVTLTVSDEFVSAADTVTARVTTSTSIRVPEDMPLAEALALAASCPIDSIHVAPGVYAGPFTVSGTDAAVVATAGPAVTRLEVDSGTAPVVEVISGAPHLKGFAVSGTGTGVRLHAPATLEGCHVIGCGATGIQIEWPSGAQVLACVVAGNGAAEPESGGISLRGTHAVTSTTVHGNEGFALRTLPWDEALAAPTIDRCLFTGTADGPGLSCQAGTAPVISCSNVWANSAGNGLCGVNGGGNFTADPQYCDPQAFELSLRPSSPCLDRPGCGQVGALGLGCGPAQSRIEGVVTGPSGPLRNRRVEALHPVTGLPVASAITNPNGGYSIPGLGGGGYRVEVTTPNTFFIGEYYPNLPSYLPENLALATPIVVDGQSVQTGINFSLALGGTFTGTVRDQPSNLPLPGVPVHAFLFPGNLLRSTLTTANGTYESVALPAGKYGALVPEIEGHFGEVYWQRQHPADGDTISVFASQRQLNIDFTLLPGNTGIPAEPPAVAAPEQALVLDPPVPNPFNPSTTIRFAIAAAVDDVRLDVHDVHGRQVRVLWDGPLAAGPHRFAWDGRNARGEAVATGVYLIRVRAGSSVETREAVLLR